MKPLLVNLKESLGKLSADETRMKEIDKALSYENARELDPKTLRTLEREQQDLQKRMTAKPESGLLEAIESSLILLEKTGKK